MLSAEGAPVVSARPSQQLELTAHASAGDYSCKGELVDTDVVLFQWSQSAGPSLDFEADPATAATHRSPRLVVSK